MQALTLARLACGHPQVGSSVATWKLSVYHHLDPSPATTPPTSRICLHLLFFFLPSFFLRGGTVGLGRILSGALRRSAERYRGPAKISIERRKERRARRRACEGGSGPEVLVNLRVPCPCHPQVWGGATPTPAAAAAHPDPLLSLASRSAAHFLGVFRIARNPSHPSRPEGTVLS